MTQVFLFTFHYFLFFDLTWKNILFSVTKCLRFKKKERKRPRKICCVRYCGRVLKIMKFQQEDTFKHYNYREEMLNYISALVPNDKKDESLEDSYKVSLKEFCEALQIKLL